MPADIQGKGRHVDPSGWNCNRLPSDTGARDLHGDHFDRVARRGLPRSQPVLTTPPAARRLQRWGFETTGLEPWKEVELSKADETLTLAALPAIHAREVMGALLPPVMGSLLERRTRGEVQPRVYISGDTLTGDHLSEIAERHPDIDVAMFHLGGTRVLMHTVTMDAELGGSAYGALSHGRRRRSTTTTTRSSDHRSRTS